MALVGMFCPVRPLHGPKSCALCLVLALQLRELVPPQGSDSPTATAAEAAAAGECRRPKHVVLADTIRLIRGLNLQAQAQQEAQQAQQAPPACQLLQQHAAAAQQPAVKAAPEQQLRGEAEAATLGQAAEGRELEARNGCPSPPAPLQQQRQQDGDVSVAAAGAEPAQACAVQLPVAPGDDVLPASGVVVEAAGGFVRVVKVGSRAPKSRQSQRI